MNNFYFQIKLFTPELFYTQPLLWCNTLVGCVCTSSGVSGSWWLWLRCRFTGHSRIVSLVGGCSLSSRTGLCFLCCIACLWGWCWWCCWWWCWWCWCHCLWSGRSGGLVCRCWRIFSVCCIGGGTGLTLCGSRDGGLNIFCRGCLISYRGRDKINGDLILL